MSHGLSCKKDTHTQKKKKISNNLANKNLVVRRKAVSLQFDRLVGDIGEI